VLSSSHPLSKDNEREALQQTRSVEKRW